MPTSKPGDNPIPSVTPTLAPTHPAVEEVEAQETVSIKENAGQAPKERQTIVTAAGSTVNKITTAIGGAADKAYNAVSHAIQSATDFVRETFHIEDEEVPLVNLDLGSPDHKCCILHLLLALISLLLLGLYTRDRKKQQKKLHELREKLDIELARRGLPVTAEEIRERKR